MRVHAKTNNLAENSVLETHEISLELTAAISCTISFGFATMLVLRASAVGSRERQPQAAEANRGDAAAGPGRGR